jgi:hypothetical protein
MLPARLSMRRAGNNVDCERFFLYENHSHRLNFPGWPVLPEAGPASFSDHDADFHCSL